MAVTVEVLGNGKYAGAKSNIGTYSVSEESTPVEASDSSGGAGQLTFTAVDDPSMFGSALLLGNEVELTDGARGELRATISAINGNDGLLTVTADSRLAKLVADKTALGVDADFDTAIRYYLGLAGIVDDIAVDDTLTDIPVAALGWTGDVWTKIKELLVVVGAEISLVRGNVVVRPVRQRRALEINNVQESWAFENADQSKFVEVYYYNSNYQPSGLIYPSGGWNEDVSILSIESGETNTVNFAVNVSIESLDQPQAEDYISRDYNASSAYSVVGNDGRPIPAAQWNADGGKITVAIGEDGRSIDVTLTGAGGDTARYSPYRIAATAGSSSYYSSLRIVGSGLHFLQESITVPTGAGDNISRDTGVSVDNVFVNTEADAREVAAAVAARWAGPVRTVQITKTDINKPGETTNDFNYASFDQFNDLYNGDLFSDFNTTWSGDSFQDFNDFWYQQVQDDFDFQVFGNANGARIQWRRAVYRIRSATITESSVNYSAEADTIFNDFNASADGLTFSDFNDTYDGLTFRDYALVPLPVVRPEYDR